MGEQAGEVVQIDVAVIVDIADARLRTAAAELIGAHVDDRDGVAAGVRRIRVVEETAFVVEIERRQFVDIAVAIEVGGEDCVGLGGDLDGVESMPIGLEGVGDYPQIAELLQRGGLSSRQVDKVCHENFARVFNQVLG